MTFKTFNKFITDNIELAFVKSYIETALWSSTDYNEVPLDDKKYKNRLTKLAQFRLVVDCLLFLKMLQREPFTSEERNTVLNDDEAAGHDFWLTRNGYGAGFWDGDWPEPLATKLTNLSKSFGGFNLDAYHGWIYPLI